MAITTGDGLMAALATAQSYSWFKYSPANIVTPMQYSLWLPNGSPVSGSTPTVATTCTSVTTGAKTIRFTQRRLLVDFSTMSTGQRFDDRRRAIPVDGLSIAKSNLHHELSFGWGNEV